MTSKTLTRPSHRDTAYNRPGMVTDEPAWSTISRSTADVLALVADLKHPSVDFEYRYFLAAVDQSRDADNYVDPNALRRRVRGHVAPNRIGAITNTLTARGVWEHDGWVISDDSEGRNGGKPAKRYRVNPTALHREAEALLSPITPTQKKTGQRTKASTGSTPVVPPVVLTKTAVTPPVVTPAAPAVPPVPPPADPEQYDLEALEAGVLFK